MNNTAINFQTIAVDFDGTLCYSNYRGNMEHIKSNYHTHTELCKHAKGMPVDFAQKAVEFNVQILGISDHAPFKDVDFGYRMLFSELDLYCDAVDKAKSDFSYKVEILKSLEIEYLPEYTKGKIKNTANEHHPKSRLQSLD